MTIDELLRQAWIVAPATTGAPALPTGGAPDPIVAGQQRIAELEAQLQTFRDQDAANLAAYQERGRLALEAWRAEPRKCSPSRSDCPGFGGQ